MSQLQRPARACSAWYISTSSCRLAPILSCIAIRIGASESRRLVLPPTFRSEVFVSWPGVITPPLQQEAVSSRRRPRRLLRQGATSVMRRLHHGNCMNRRSGGAAAAQRRLQQRGRSAGLGLRLGGWCDLGPPNFFSTARSRLVDSCHRMLRECLPSSDCRRKSCMTSLMNESSGSRPSNLPLSTQKRTSAAKVFRSPDMMLASIVDGDK